MKSWKKYVIEEGERGLNEGGFHKPTQLLSACPETRTPSPPFGCHSSGRLAQTFDCRRRINRDGTVIACVDYEDDDTARGLLQSRLIIKAICFVFIGGSEVVALLSVARDECSTRTTGPSTKIF